MIVLDTHAWVWYLSDPRALSPRAIEAINAAKKENDILVSSISVWEVALLVKKGRLELTMATNDWIKKSEQLPFFSFVPIDNAIALKSINLKEPFHDDPADRIIVATAVLSSAKLVTKDTNIHSCRYVKTIW